MYTSAGKNLYTRPSTLIQSYPPPPALCSGKEKHTLIFDDFGERAAYFKMLNKKISELS